MELGGNAPFIVFDDADLEVALDGAMFAKMRNAGEACTAANRLYVQAGIHDAFADGLSKRMAALTVGAGTTSHTECGPMITRKAVDKIDRLVQDAVARGAKVLCGGAIAEGKGLLLPADGAARRVRRRRNGTRGDLRSGGSDPALRQRGGCHRQGQ